MHLTFLTIWGRLATINLYNCNKELIKDKTQIKKFGKSSLKGHSIMQFIETSTITIHFDEIENRIFIDIFSCKKFDIKKAEKFSKEFFKAKKVKNRIIS